MAAARADGRVPSLLRHRNEGQVALVCEALRRGAFHAVDGLKAACLECVVVDVRHVGWDRHAGQGKASIERVFFDGIYAAAYRHVRERATIGE